MKVLVVADESAHGDGVVRAVSEMGHAAEVHVTREGTPLRFDGYDVVLAVIGSDTKVAHQVAKELAMGGRTRAVGFIVSPDSPADAVHACARLGPTLPAWWTPIDLGRVMRTLQLRRSPWSMRRRFPSGSTSPGAARVEVDCSSWIHVFSLCERRAFLEVGGCSELERGAPVEVTLRLPRSEKVTVSGRVAAVHDDPERGSTTFVDLTGLTSELVAWLREMADWES